MPTTESRPTPAANMKLSDAVMKVISLAKVIREYWEAELPKRHPNYPVTNPGEQPVPQPPEEKRLAKLLVSLPEDTVYQIGLLTYLGSGGFDVREIAEFYRSLKENYDDVNSLTAVLIAKAPLADYLQDGLAELRKHNIDVDRLPLKPAKVRK